MGKCFKNYHAGGKSRSFSPSWEVNTVLGVDARIQKCRINLSVCRLREHCQHSAPTILGDILALRRILALLEISEKQPRETLEFPAELCQPLSHNPINPSQSCPALAAAAAGAFRPSMDPSLHLAPNLGLNCSKGPLPRGSIPVQCSFAGKKYPGAF